MWQYSSYFDQEAKAGGPQHKILSSFFPNHDHSCLVASDKRSPPPPFLHFVLVLQTPGLKQSCSNNPLYCSPQNWAPNLRTDVKKLKSKPKRQLTRGKRRDLNWKQNKMIKTKPFTRTYKLRFLIFEPRARHWKFCNSKRSWIDDSWRVTVWSAIFADLVFYDFYAWLHELRECDIWESRVKHL